MISITQEIKVHKILSRLVMPFTENERKVYAKTMLSDKPTYMIHVWNGYHLGDQELLEMCIKCNHPYQISHLENSTINDAIRYLCKEQLQREQLTGMYRKYLIGQLFLVNWDGKQDAKMSVAEEIGKDLFLAGGTILKYSYATVALNDLYAVSETLVLRILLEKTRVSHDNLIELSRLRAEEINAIFKVVERDKVEHLNIAFIRNEAKYSHVNPRGIKSRREKQEEKLSKDALIRQMPVFNPDSEVNSLCMTIDTWIASIKRVSSSDKFPQISNKASLHLMKKLTILEHTIKATQFELEERTNV